MSLWEDHHFEERIMAILRDAQHNHQSNLHFGRPFLTAYQIAIEFDQLHPNVRRETGWPIGGKGSGEYESLSRYIARQLSAKLRDAESDDPISAIEGGFISNKNMQDLNFEFGDREEIQSSSTNSSFEVSIFRLRA